MPRKRAVRATQSLFSEVRETFDVDRLTEHLQNLFGSDGALKSIVVTGELRESKLHTSGHFYFSLHGKDTRISCALFKQYSHNMSWAKDGDKVIAEGQVDIYPARGTYQFYVKKLVPVGEGAVERARRETQARLEAEGLFSPSLKRALPRLPERIALVTSQTGAAVQDVIKVAGTRWKMCEIVVVPTLVQGFDAPGEIIKALYKAAFVRNAECVMLVRGGGGREDLVPFDDADVVRAVRSCPLPVITGLGHQQDLTLCDLAADFSAPTPSAAAERLFPDSEAVMNWFGTQFSMLNNAISRRVERAHSTLSEMRSAMGSQVKIRLNEANANISKRAAMLDTLSPLSVLSRGFVICEARGARVTSIKQIAENEDITLNFSDGRAEAKISGRIES